MGLMSSQQPELSYEKVKVITNIISNEKMVEKKGAIPSYSFFLPPALCEVSCLQTFAYTPLFCPVFHLGKSFTTFKIQLWYRPLWDAFLDPFSLNVAHSPLYQWGLAPVWVFVFLTLFYDYIPHCPQPYLRNIYYRGWAELVISLYAPSTMYSDWHGQNFCKYFINEQGLSEIRMKRGQPPKESFPVCPRWSGLPNPLWDMCCF